MGRDKVQGEGDYEAARRFREDETGFAKNHGKDGKKFRGDAEDATDKPTEEEREGRSHAKRADQDKHDARRMREMEKKKG